MRDLHLLEVGHDLLYAQRRIAPRIPVHDVFLKHKRRHDGDTWSGSTLRIEQVVTDLNDFGVPLGVARKLAPPLVARLAVGRTLAPPAAAAPHAAGSATVAGV
jgi:hypothetical protein